MRFELYFEGKLVARNAIFGDGDYDAIAFHNGFCRELVKCGKSIHRVRTCVIDQNDCVIRVLVADNVVSAAEYCGASLARSILNAG